MWMKPTKIVVVATHSTDKKTNFKLIIYSHGPVDFEIVYLTRMVKNKYKQEIEPKHVARHSSFRQPS